MTYYDCILQVAYIVGSDNVTALTDSAKLYLHSLGGE